jgi:hypothetical protein
LNNTLLAMIWSFYMLNYSAKELFYVTEDVNANVDHFCYASSTVPMTSTRQPNNTSPVQGRCERCSGEQFFYKKNKLETEKRCLSFTFTEQSDWRELISNV